MATKIVVISKTGTRVSSLLPPPGPLLKAYEMSKIETRKAEQALFKADGLGTSDKTLEKLQAKVTAAREKRNAAFKAWLESDE